jgi:hypothetical protein
MQDPMSPAERKMLQVLDRSWLIPGSVKSAIKYEWARGKPGVALGMLALWQVALRRDDRAAPGAHGTVSSCRWVFVHGLGSEGIVFASNHWLAPAAQGG